MYISFSLKIYVCYSIFRSISSNNHHPLEKPLSLSCAIILKYVATISVTKVMPYRLDQILGKQGSKAKDVYASKISLASRVVKVERQVSKNIDSSK